MSRRPPTGRTAPTRRGSSTTGRASRSGRPPHPVTLSRSTSLRSARRSRPRRSSRSASTTRSTPPRPGTRTTRCPSLHEIPLCDRAGRRMSSPCRAATSTGRSSWYRDLPRGARRRSRGRLGSHRRRHHRAGPVGARRAERGFAAAVQPRQVVHRIRADRPWLVTPDELPNRDDLAIGCALDGEQMQTGRTSAMIYSVPILIERLSAIITLYPGDIIFSGRPPASATLGRRSASSSRTRCWSVRSRASAT